MNVKRQFLLVVNPKAGSIDKKDMIDSVQRAILSRDWLCKVYETNGKDDGVQIDILIHDLKPYRILIAGGDGTINLVAHVLRIYDISIGILPAGSANGLASNFGLPDNLNAQIDVALGDHTFAIDHLLVNQQTCLHIADLGINAELMANFKDATIRGKFGYFLKIIPTLIKTDSPFDFTIDINGEQLNRIGILLAIANANQYGTGAKINPNGRMDDGEFEVLLFKSFNAIKILRTLYDKIDFKSGFAECHKTKHVVITTKAPVPLQIDGEPQPRTQRVEVCVHDKRLRIALPEQIGHVS